MNITLLGATGFVGKELVKQALELGYQVKVLVRDKARVPEIFNRVEVVEGDYFDAEALSMAIKGSDVVMSTIGPIPKRNSRQTPQQFFDAMERLVAVMEKHHVKRLINVASAGTCFENEQPNWQRRALRWSLSYVAPLVIPGKEQELAVLSQSDLEWTTVRPPLIKAASKGSLHSHATVTQGFSVDLTQLCQFMLEQIENDAFIRQAPFVGTR